MKHAGRGMSGWSWDESFNVLQRAQLARRIVADLDTRLRAIPGTRIYAATGHPTVSRYLEKALGEVAGGAGSLCRVARQRRPDAYVTSDPGLFTRVLPVVFEFGPPEVAILAIAADLDATQNGLDAMITRVVAGRDSSNSDAVCMHFDSGDLVSVVLTSATM